MTIKQIQYTLIALGYDPGIADGISGPNTRKAIVEFQKDAELTADGVAGKLTQQAMCDWLIASKVKSSFDNLVQSTQSITTQKTSDTTTTFKPRLTRPEAGNKFYNTVSNGGYSNAIVGKPTDAGCNVLSNCVGYARGRFNEISGSWKYNIWGNAEDWWANKGSLEGGQTPKLGAVACWAKGQAGNSLDGAGHVAIVEQINADGSIVTSESGYNCTNPFWTKKRYKGNGNWGASGYTFQGFIYNPSVK